MHKTLKQVWIVTVVPPEVKGATGRRGPPANVAFGVMAHVEAEM